MNTSEQLRRLADDFEQQAASALPEDDRLEQLRNSRHQLACILSQAHLAGTLPDDFLPQKEQVLILELLTTFCVDAADLPDDKTYFALKEDKDKWDLKALQLWRGLTPGLVFDEATHADETGEEYYLLNAILLNCKLGIQPEQVIHAERNNWNVHLHSTARNHASICNRLADMLETAAASKNPAKPATKKTGPIPKPLTEAEQECLRLHSGGMKPQQIDEELMHKYAWNYGDARKCLDRQRKRRN